MKKLFIFILFIFNIVAINAQILTFRTTGYYERQKYDWGWGNWSSKQASNMNIVINLNNDVVTIYSPTTQIYNIYKYIGTKKDSDGDITMTYKFYDQDLDFGNMRLMIRKNGQSQIYIDFSNISWAYDVIRTN